MDSTSPHPLSLSLSVCLPVPHLQSRPQHTVSQQQGCEGGCGGGCEGGVMVEPVHNPPLVMVKTSHGQ